MTNSQQKKENKDSGCLGCLTAAVCCCCLAGTSWVLYLALFFSPSTDGLRFGQRCAVDEWRFSDVDGKFSCYSTAYTAQDMLFYLDYLLNICRVWICLASE